MSQAKISEHEPTAVKRENTETSKPTSVEDAKERLRRSGMTEGTAGSTLSNYYRIINYLLVDLCGWISVERINTRSILSRLVYVTF